MLKTFLGKHEFEIEEATTGKEGQRKLFDADYDLLLTDLRLPEMDGIELLQVARRQNSNLPVILMTSFADVKTAVRAMKLGAYEYVTKPINPEELLLTVKAAIRSREQEEAPIVEKSEFVKGKSDAALRIEEYIQLVGPTKMSVLIQGESGTGKEYIAKQIHQNSKRSDEPFVAVDCGTLQKELAGSELFGHVKGAFTGALHDKQGQFQEAAGGTLFLDEIGNLPYEVQISLLRALQERKVKPVGGRQDEDVDVRILAATNENLMASVEQGKFREDLYHRLNEFTIAAPALRERQEDIAQFARHFLKIANQELDRSILGFDDEVLAIFAKYNWPGNLRELRNIVRRAVLLARTEHIEVSDLPEEMQEQVEGEVLTNGKPNFKVPETVDLKLLAEQNEREMIQKALRQANFNKSKAARLLNIDRKTLYNKLKLYNMEL
jgi:two-component system response regulator HydG